MVQTTNPKGAAKAEAVRIIPWLQVRILPVPFLHPVDAAAGTLADRSQATRPFLAATGGSASRSSSRRRLPRADNRHRSESPIPGHCRTAVQNQEHTGRR